MEGLGAESGLVAIPALLWDYDVIPGTETGGEANKGKKRVRGRQGGAGGGSTRGWTKKTCRDDPQMADES